MGTSALSGPPGQGPARTKVHPTTAPPAPICGMARSACGSRARRHGASERTCYHDC